jgi:DNA-binding XRE family transcriptional regulator
MQRGAFPHVRPAAAPQRHGTVTLLRYGFGLPIGVRVVRIVKIPVPIIPPPETLAEHLYQHRKKSKQLQKEVASILGITKESYHNWEHGKSMPLPSYYPKLIAWLGYDPLPTPTSDGQKLKHHRLRSGLSQEEAAKEAGVDHQTFTLCEHNEWVRGIAGEKVWEWMNKQEAVIAKPD